MSTFRAAVQYDDFSGTVAADVSDNVSFLDHLRESKLAGSDEHLAGIRIASSAITGVDVDGVSVVAYLCKSDTFNSDPDYVRAVEVRMPPSKILSFFKRFDLVMTRKGIRLDGAEVDGPHY